MQIPRRPARLLAAPAFAVLLAACGVDTDTTSTTGSDASAAASGVQAIGEANQELLQPADDARDVEVLNVADGSIATLRESVDGDRPVLLWFFSPH